jgi:hypothetical protein
MDKMIKILSQDKEPILIPQDDWQAMSCYAGSLAFYRDRPRTDTKYQIAYSMEKERYQEIKSKYL